MLSIRAFGRRDYGKHLGEVILNLGQWLLLSPGSCLKGRTWGSDLGIKKLILPNMAMWHIKFKGVMSRTV